jgi:phosphate transport system permease protein
LQDKRSLLGRNPFLPNHLPKTFNILLQLNFWKPIAEVNEVAIKVIRIGQGSSFILLPDIIFDPQVKLSPFGRTLPCGSTNRRERSPAMSEKLNDKVKSIYQQNVQKKADIFFHWLTALCALLMLVLMVGIFWQLMSHSLLAIHKFGFRFLISQAWDPVSQEFGAASSIYGTMVSTCLAMILAVPAGLVIALFLVELAPPSISRIVGYAIELLAAIPSIIYGMWGLFVFAPFMADHVQPALGKTLGFLPLFQGPPMGIGMLTAGIILALMILPFITAVSRDIFKMVPAVLKESAYGLGSTTWEVTQKVTVSYGLQGLLGAAFLGLGRAIGETMAVTFVIGNDHAISASLFSAGNSIASTLANEFAEASEPLYLSALMKLGLVLFVITILIQILAQLWLKRVGKRMGGRL